MREITHACEWRRGSFSSIYFYAFLSLSLSLRYIPTCTHKFSRGGGGGGGSRARARELTLDGVIINAGYYDDKVVSASDAE